MSKWQTSDSPAPALTEAEIEAYSLYRWDEEGKAWVLETLPSL